MRRSKLRISKMWKSRLTSILSIVTGTALATPQNSRMCPKGQLSKSLPDGFRETLPKRVCAKCHGMILPYILGISWASTAIPLMEHGMVMEGESIQAASAKSIIPFDHSSLMSSFRSALFKGSGGEAIFGEMNGDTSIISLNGSWLRWCSTVGSSGQEIRVAKAVSSDLCLRLPCDDFHEEAFLKGSLQEVQNQRSDRCESLIWPRFCLSWPALPARSPDIQRIVPKDFGRVCRSGLQACFLSMSPWGIQTWCKPRQWSHEGLLRNFPL